MKKIFSLAILATMLFASSCNNESVAPKGAKTYKATIEDATTRTALAADGNVYHVNWVAGDQVALTDGTNTAVLKAKTGGSNFTEFEMASGTEPTNVPTAYYPVSIAGGKLASVQTYVAGNIAESPMIGTVNDDKISFKNLCGIIKFDLTSTAAGEKVIAVSVSADQGLAGTYTVKDNAAVVSDLAGITLSCPEGVAIGATAVPFFVSVPAGSYTNLAVKVVTASGKAQTLKAKSAIAIERSKVSTITLAVNNLAENKAGVALLPSGKDFSATMKSLNDPSAVAESSDYSIKKIVFQASSSIAAGTNIAKIDSQEPVYMSWDAATGTVTFATPSKEFTVAEDASYMFAELAALESIENISALNTSATTDMSHMFSAQSCDTTALVALDLTSFDVSKVTTFKGMFQSNRNLNTVKVTGWKTESVEDMSYMFDHTSCLKDLDLSNWNNENCIDFSYMFNFSHVNKINLKNFTTPNATTMLYMFASTEGLETLDVSSFITENVSNFGNMFYHAYTVQSITGLDKWDTSASTLFRSMFNRCDKVVELDCSSFDISSATNCQYMFYKCVSLQKVDISGFDASGLAASVFAYSLPKLENIREIYFGEDFIPVDPTKVPDGFTMYYADLEEESMASQNPTRTVNVYCSQEVAEYLVTTDMHYPHNGWHYVTSSADRTHQPITINMLDFKTKKPLSVDWPANEYYPL